MITEKQIKQLLDAQNKNDFVAMLKISEQLLQIAPQSDFLLHANAIALCRLNNIEKSIEVLKQAIIFAPNNSKKFDLQIELCEILITSSMKKTNWLEAKNILLNLHNQQSNYNGFNNIKNSKILSLLCDVCIKLNDLITAEKFANELILQYPKADGHFWLGKIFMNLDKNMAAINEFQQAVKFQPDNFWALDYLTVLLCGIGESELSYQLLQNYLPKIEQQNHPDFVNFYHRNLTVVHYLSNVSANLISQHTQKFSNLVKKRYPQKYTQQFFHEKYQKIFIKNKQNLVENNKNNQKQKLKIGFVSGDLNSHVVSLFLRNLFKNLHTQNSSLEIFAYMTRPNEDSVSEELKKYCKIWRNISEFNDDKAVEIIFADDIQILFDLSGLTPHHRLFMFAHRAAPIQISWIGWLGTTGIPTMDYFLADEFCVSSGEKYEQQFSEKVLRMPNIWEVLTPPDFPREIQKNFCESRGNESFMFASFNNPNKVNSKTLDLWCEVLKKSPENTQFIWLRGDFSETAMQEKFLNEFVKRGVNKNQISLKNYENYQNYLQQICEVDLILDSVQFSGMTTTAEALSLGTPTITLLGDLMPSRLSGSCINAIGDENLNKNFIFDNQTDFVNQAVFFANNPQKLNELKFGLAEKARKSPLCDAELFAKDFEAKMWEVWNNFLEN